jgi:hypothetical protein
MVAIRAPFHTSASPLRKRLAAISGWSCAPAPPLPERIGQAGAKLADKIPPKAPQEGQDTPLWRGERQGLSPKSVKSLVKGLAALVLGLFPKA